ncbi:Guanine nucleotide exchange factor LTE1 like protein [Verticillium longisporum]|nr:Guanine nucleotide exchange factor LTE1 like protein [Verticillium longisporum]
MTKFSVHLPFILAFDSEILAQQFTLIEKDALNEIDWKELIEMGWKNATNNDSRSWVDFLRNTDAHGVEVVIARFNIMVKWACSEIVLTQNIEERARCIIKFIHLAAHCHRFRNFATMSQIAIALTSQEVARLSKTWAMVPRRDMQTLQELELLVSPTRNFHNLRAEMEGGSDSGCIPFVGIYTHDLLFNAQRPSEIASSPTTAPLVNFERCRYAATIVKTLLRLLEASTLYQFQPVEGITERCLWMGALTDEEIRRHSESLE